MNTRSPLPVPPWMLAVAAMFSVQLGSALSVPMISQVGPAGTAWLRLSAGALIFLAVARPALRTLNRRDHQTVVAYPATRAASASATRAAPT